VLNDAARAEPTGLDFLDSVLREESTPHSGPALPGG
jgi:hypothetical protein